MQITGKKKMNMLLCYKKLPFYFFKYEALQSYVHRLVMN